MSETKKIRIVLDLQQKYEAIQKLDKGIPAYKVAEELGVGKTQIQNLRKRKIEVISDFENNVPMNTKRRRHATGDILLKQQCLQNVLTQHSTDVTNDIVDTRDDLMDLLIEKGCIADDERSCDIDAASDTPRDKAHKLVLRIMKRSYKTMDTFLQCMKKYHKELVEKIYNSFEECMNWMRIKMTCSFCFLKNSVDIKTVSELTFRKQFINQLLHEDIRNPRLTTDARWQMFAEHCNLKDSKDVKKVITTIQRDLKNRGQYCELVEHLRTMHAFICECESLQSDKKETKLHQELIKWRSPRHVFGQTERIETEHTACCTEVDGGYSHDQRVADEHQDERMSDSRTEQRKRLCLEKAISLNRLSLIDNMTLHLRNKQQV